MQFGTLFHPLQVSQVGLIESQGQPSIIPASYNILGISSRRIPSQGRHSVKVARHISSSSSPTSRKRELKPAL
ncbi:uncharacterized protein UV8b_00881 [Ustilaginoidea virens]|uniref:Uncharacterized protein n=1 Tax=Ustilaginoidea virens TaxID=1159556 RepID=A0A8E5HJL6_USTVR|nr:uncharacterized protein UV8b_00881 [Ustilaginoidea virens]QUC16640.1 hypothetical protein UV8b_00881 [Ustilaginoidea virens]